MVDFIGGRRPKPDTVPGSYVEIHSAFTTDTTVNLPTVVGDTVAVSNTFTLPLTIKPGYLVYEFFRASIVGFDYSTRMWDGFWRRLDNVVNPPPYGYDQSNEIVWTTPSVQTLEDPFIVYNIFNRNTITLEQRFTLSTRSGSAPYPCRVRFGLKVFKPSSFVAWNP
jgi:hypothetical protein